MKTLSVILAEGDRTVLVNVRSALRWLKWNLNRNANINNILNRKLLQIHKFTVH